MPRIEPCSEKRSKDSTVNAIENSFLERLQNDGVLVAEEYLFELERRGYLKAGPFVPEVVLQQPEAVKQLHEEFVRAGSDVVVACTYYGHRAKLKAVGLEHKLQEVNLTALRIAREVARSSDTLLAGDLSNTWEFESQSDRSAKLVRAIFPLASSLRSCYD
jgi:betaine-homocysteine S-methyltransferase